MWIDNHIVLVMPGLAHMSIHAYATLSRLELLSASCRASRAAEDPSSTIDTVRYHWKQRQSPLSVSSAVPSHLLVHAGFLRLPPV